MEPTFISKVQEEPKGHKLILLTMVKNESRIIKRLLSSVKGKADGIVVLDTGSTDNTIALAKEFLETNNIPGGVYESPFVNFGKTRTKSFEACQDWVKRIGWNAKECWSLLLDGDMMLGEGQTIHKGALEALPETAAGVTLKQANGSLVYNNVRLIRCSEPWICKGATHEAWTCPPQRHVINFDSPILVDLNDGGCKSDKYPRDVRLLLGDLEEMPNDARTHFYLAQTYLCMGAHDKAIPILRKRIEIGGWEEEVYIAYMYLGECLMATKQESEAVKVWLDGWQYRQHRTEIPVKLIHHYRLKDKSQFLAMMFFEKLYAIQYGEDLRTGSKIGPALENRDTLFVNKRNTDFHMWEEALILAYYTGVQRPIWLQMDKWDVTSSLGYHDFNTLFHHMHWYDWLLQPSRKTRIQIPLAKLPWADESEGHVWQPFNPSIRQKADKSGYHLNIRYANYWTDEAKWYKYRGFDGQVLTRNCFTEIGKDADWNHPISVSEIKIDPKYPQKPGEHVKGMEDCRLIQYSDSLEFLGTSRSYTMSEANKIFHVTKQLEDETWNIRELPLPSCTYPAECQKNWMGFRHGPKQELLYIYSFTPFRVCDEYGNIRVQFDTFKCGKDKFSIKDYRGSAGPASWSSCVYPEEAYLCVMHKVVVGGEGRRYYHRFLTLDKNLQPSRVSCLVRMSKERVEYWSGMCENIEGDGYWITYGCKDSEAYIAELKKESIEDFLFYDVQNGSMVRTQVRMKRLEGY